MSELPGLVFLGGGQMAEAIIRGVVAAAAPGPARGRRPDPHPGSDRDLVVVEGAGGLLVRYDEEGATLADLAHDLRAHDLRAHDLRAHDLGSRDLGAHHLGAAVLVVVDPVGLGTLNHTALTLEALAHRGLALAGVVHRRLAGRPRPGLPQQHPRPRDAGRPAARRRDARAAPARWTPPEFLLAARAGLGPSLGGAFDAADFRRAYD